MHSFTCFVRTKHPIKKINGPSSSTTTRDFKIQPLSDVHVCWQRGVPVEILTTEVRTATWAHVGGGARERRTCQDMWVPLWWPRRLRDLFVRPALPTVPPFGVSFFFVHFDMTHPTFLVADITYFIVFIKCRYELMNKCLFIGADVIILVILWFVLVCFDIFFIYFFFFEYQLYLESYIIFHVRVWMRHDQLLERNENLERERYACRSLWLKNIIFWSAKESERDIHWEKFRGKRFI